MVFHASLSYTETPCLKNKNQHGNNNDEDEDGEGKQGEEGDNDPKPQPYLFSPYWGRISEYVVLKPDIEG